jgi:hypothetical protein
MTRYEYVLICIGLFITVGVSAWALLQLLLLFGWRAVPIVLFILVLHTYTIAMLLRRLPSAK